MKRKTHEREVRKKIIKAARQLFLEQGFDNTTIRQITQKAAISTGTLYHFYQDKEDIFFHIADETFLKVIAKSEELVPDEDIYLRLVCEMAIHIQSFLSNRNTAELYVIAYGSYKISEEVMLKQHPRMKAFINAQGSPLKDADMPLISLTIKGLLHALALKAMNNEYLVPSTVIAQSSRLILSLLAVPASEIETTISQLERLDIPKGLALKMQ